MSQAPAGWFPQPDGTQRYWDGSQWTEHVSGTPTAPAAPPAPPAPAADEAAVVETAAPKAKKTTAKAKTAAAAEPAPAEPIAAPAPTVIAGSDMPMPASVPAAAAPAVVATGETASLSDGSAKKRKIWPIVLGVAGALLVMFIIAIVAIVLVVKNAVGDPGATVIQYDQSWQEVDCALMQDSVTQYYQETQGFTNCADFEAAAQDFVDTLDTYTVTILSTEIVNDTATVTTSEFYSDTEGYESTYEYEYTLVKESGEWLIDDIWTLTAE